MGLQPHFWKEAETNKIHAGAYSEAISPKDEDLLRKFYRMHDEAFFLTTDEQFSLS